MKTYGIVYASSGEQIAEITTDTMEHALQTFAEQMPHNLYRRVWIYAWLGSAPYILTDTMTEITAFEY